MSEAFRGQDGAIAVVGVACRLPRAAGPAAFWVLLRDGLDAVSATPADRWGVAAS
ncbi:beta-ketoacyl synthase N-terminal-like domain-containing protein, partial [Micromonospora sp. NPDC051141]|uniref:beta-ketoacyl synthase N-terminal-like domain-containing protein n=1 Tax=Micromonospora sp. NPDC051141 TaxID=3364284 RepID=UPI0037A2CB73